MSRSILFTATYKNGKTISHGCHIPANIEYQMSLIDYKQIRLTLFNLIGSIKDKKLLKLTATIHLSGSNSKDQYPHEIIIPMNHKNPVMYYSQQYAINITRLVNIVYLTASAQEKLL